MTMIQLVKALSSTDKLEKPDFDESLNEEEGPKFCEFKWADRYL